MSPLTLSFDVACSVDHAFEMWTQRISVWWPPDHTVTGAPDDVVLERGVGGRIYERSGDGVEHEWGAVTVWEPPTRLGYSWHLGRGSVDATDVEIRFVAEGERRTRVEIEHGGWERLGDTAGVWRDRNRVGWETLLPHFAAFVTQGES